MATSQCSKCGCTSFEMVSAKIKGSAFNFYFIQCSSCGTVVGITEYYNIGERLNKLAKKLNITID